MIKDIRYSGFATAPSDYDCPDGQLAVSLGAIVEDGALHPIRKPSEVFTLKNGATVLALHDGRYIIADSTHKELSWTTDGKTKGQIGETDTPVTQVTSLGNTLIALTANGPMYFLWSDGAYKPLGSKIPDVDISFGLIGRPRLFSVSDESKKKFNITFLPISQGDVDNNKELSSENKVKITNQVMAMVNKFVAEQTVQKGRFCFPFFVRYALRLYDDSLIMHSAPILMNPSTKAAPIVLWEPTISGDIFNADCDIMLMAATLDYQFLQTNESESLANWKDIVKSVDVFVSRPIYTYDQGGEISQMADADNFNSKFIGRLFNNGKSGEVEEDKLLGEINGYLDGKYAEWKYDQIYGLYFSTDRTHPKKTFHLPEFSDGKVRETLQNTASFYKLCSIPIEELTANKVERTEIVVDDEYLQALTNREVMTDDYLTHDRITAEDAYAYNNRLNLSGLSRKPFRGFYAESMFAYCNSTIGMEYVGNKVNIYFGTGNNQKYEIVVCIKEDGVESIVRSDLFTDFSGSNFNTLVQYLSYWENGADSKRSFGCYLFYPNANAYKMIVRNSGSGSEYEVKLTPHEFLNGAYCLLDYEMERDVNTEEIPDIAENVFPMPNKLYTSEVNNPFYFPLSGINTVGTGRIIGISSAAKALSEGQFGQFPLYAFTTEGVWAMEVAADGTYSARQPISRDVCTGRESITQMDSSVLFATERGIMQISGSAVSCITDSIDADKSFSPASLPLLHLISLDATNLKATPLRQFVKGCSMVYDYTNQQVIVSNPAYEHALVLSLKSGQWAHMGMKIDRAVPSYPNALAMMKNTLVDFSTRLDEDVNVSLITRPFKLDAPDIHKTIRQIIQRGVGNTGIQALYASNDLQNWVSVWACNGARMGAFSGTPYKYFRMALSLEATAYTSLSGFSVEYLPKLTDRLR